MERNSRHTVIRQSTSATREKKVSYREIKNLEKILDGKGEDLPVTHRYAEGLYSRELFMPKGMCLVGKMHGKSHFFILFSGEISIWDGNSFNKKIMAPQLFKTEPGTKRVIFAHQDSVLITFHATQNTTPEEIESEIIIPEYEESLFLERLKESLKQLEHTPS